jgi:hypothetical protein
MRDRITNGHLDRLVDILNKETGSPAEPYTKGDDGRYYTNVGNYHLGSAYGGVELVRMDNESGGVSTVISRGTKRELYDRLRAMLDGIRIAKNI